MYDVLQRLRSLQSRFNWLAGTSAASVLEARDDKTDPGHTPFHYIAPNDAASIAIVHYVPSLRDCSYAQNDMLSGIFLRLVGIHARGQPFI